MFCSGKPLILDFFLENSDTEFENQLQERAKAAQGGTNEVQAVFDAMQKAMSPSVIQWEHRCMAVHAQPYAPALYLKKLVDCYFKSVQELK